MAKLFEEVVSGNSSSAYADILIHFSLNAADSAAGALAAANRPTAERGCASPPPRCLPTPPTEGVSSVSASAAAGPANGEAPSNSALERGCFTPGERNSSENVSAVSPRNGVATTPAASNASPNHMHSPNRHPAGPLNGTDGGPQAVPTSLRCHSLVLRTQPSLMHVLAPNWGRESTPDNGESEAAGPSNFSVPDSNPRLHEVTVDDEPEVFLEMIRFVYLSTCNVDDSNVKALMLVADRYNLEDVVKHCLQWMQEHFTTNLFFNFLTFKLSQPRFQQLLEQSLLLALRSRHHFTLLTEDPGCRWEQLPVSFVQALLGSDELPVVSEAEVLHLLSKWAAGAIMRQESESGEIKSPPSGASPRVEPVETPTAQQEADGSCSGNMSTEDSGGEGASISSAPEGNAQHSDSARPRSESAISTHCSDTERTANAAGAVLDPAKEEANSQRRRDMLLLLQTFRRSDIYVKISDLEPILQILEVSSLFCGKPPRENGAMDPGFVICRGVAGVNVAAPFGHGLTRPDVVTHAWKGDSVSLAKDDFLQQQDGFRPYQAAEGDTMSFPRLWLRITCPSWSHREKRTPSNKAGQGHLRHSISGPLGAGTEESVSSTLMSMPVHEVPPVGGSSWKAMQSQDDWEIGRKPRSGIPVPNISDQEKIDHKVICAVISGHMQHGIRIGQRQRSSIYDIDDINNQCGEEMVCIGGTPTEIEFELQLTAQAPNHCGICQCALAVLPAGAPDYPSKDQDTLMEIAFDASSEEALHFRISSSHFDSNSSYSVEMSWVFSQQLRAGSLLSEVPTARAHV